MKKAILFIVAFIVCAPVFVGLSADSLPASLFALAWGAAWWVFFTSTKIGRRMYRKGYRIAATIMQDC